MYVFVEIQFDLTHFVQTVKKNFDKSKVMFMISNVQFASGLMKAKAVLQKEEGYSEVRVPQAKPRAPGEVLGCTSPFLDLPHVYEDTNDATIVFLSDGRFHIESTMLFNPVQKYYQYTLSLIHICRCRRYAVCRSRWSPYH
eukprot:TRINITY_DN13896_c0_g2_i2.p1 TRINITY_DN13896_c0_g2~~TRINITY_DN13896_c0_g2_i2.p1  ORF type:complete len:141 (-),score=42.17 TRINITY_DN13896_c0_g2_i2:22-444(-)